MSDNDSRDDGKVGAFLLGFLFGVIVCLGAGGMLFVVQAGRMGAAEAAARDMAEQARMEREMMLEEQKRRDLAEKAAREAKEAAEKPNN